MQYIFTKKFDGTFTMSWVGYPISTDEISNQVHDIKTFSITPTKSIKEITSFTDIVNGEDDEHYFQKYFSYSNTRSDINFSEQIPISGITREYCNLNDLYLNLYYYRMDTNVATVPNLSINMIVIEGTYDIETTDEIIEVPDDGYIFEPKNIYKVFKLTGFEIYGVNTNNLEIKYRFTQDGGRRYTPWEKLTTENISTIKLFQTRFAQVQYHVSKIDNSITSKIFDIILLGDFQNINNYYLKTNRYGVREDCASAYAQWSGQTNALGNSSSNVSNVCLSGITSNGKYKGDDTTGFKGIPPYNYNRDWFTQGLSCYLSGNIITSLSSNQTGSSSNVTNAGDAGNGSGSSSTFNPYAASSITKIANLYNYLSGTIGKIIGWTVDYHLNDPDGNGIDKYLHEYQLFNIIDVKKIKIIVPENNFPDNQVQFNEFMLDMMESFKVIILKDEFHAAFGIDKRPGQKDVIFFCQANRLYRVKHTQIHRDVMYMGIYYDVILEKYEHLANEQNLSEASNNLINKLTKNNTIDALFGEDMREDENKIINKQLKPTTHEVYRADINPKIKIVKRDIFNSLKGTIVADKYYDLSSITAGLSAITYTKKDTTLLVSDNRAFNLWFNFDSKFDSNKIITEDTFRAYNVKNNINFNLLTNYDSLYQKGYKIDYANKQIILTVNELRYTLNVPDIKTNIWYALNINIDNRQNIISLDLFRRNYEYNITMFTDKYEKVILNSNNTSDINYYLSQGYRSVKNTEINSILTNVDLKNVASIEYDNTPLNEFNIDEIITIYSSDIKLTNIRIFNDIIPNESKSNVLLEKVVKDSNHLILADNANGKLYTENILNTRWD